MIYTGALDMETQSYDLLFCSRFFFLEGHRSAVDAVSQARLVSGTILEHVSKMCMTSGTQNLHSPHAMGRVNFSNDVVVFAIVLFKLKASIQDNGGGE